MNEINFIKKYKQRLLNETKCSEICNKHIRII